MPDEILTPPDPAAELAAMKAELAAAKEKLAKLAPAPEPELLDKARKNREEIDNDTSRTKRLESALTFNLKAPEFLKQNGSLLPKDVGDIFTQAEKETYSDAIEKDGAIKSGLIQSFFGVQSNLDLLTHGQKSALDEYLKLTKNNKQENAQKIYEMVFEPAFEMLRRSKKADALLKGHGGDNSQDDYKNRIMQSSIKHYLGEKHGA